VDRFLLFSGSRYYPQGGWADFVGSFVSAEAAIAAVVPAVARTDWWQVIDGVTGEVIVSQSLDWATGESYDDPVERS